MRTGERTDIHNTIDYTVDLTKELEDGTISMEDYLDERAKRVGRGNILQNVLLPLFSSPTLWYKRLKELTFH
ncbi:MAG: hypothetical protein M3495_05850 [Pseudomonadota bacterium]|nr:hypothetical protein [Pseudomonadota bacterium]